MSVRTIAVGLKIPDNEAYTAQSALRRLGVAVARLERAEIWQFEDRGDPATFLERVRRNEALFNPNKHRVWTLEGDSPRAGEVWIEELDGIFELPGGKGVAQTRALRHAVGWRLAGDDGAPADRATVGRAVKTLLCNPAIERAIYG